MTTSDEAFRDLLERALTGSDEAARELLHQYEGYLLNAIRARLHQKLRPKFDSLDFAQEVWGAFFAQPPTGAALESPAALVAFLTKLAKHKVLDATRQRLAGQKYSVQRECSLDDSTRIDKDNFVSPDATPSQILSKEEEWGAFLSKQPPVYQRIYTLLREGKTSVEIADELDIDCRLVRRVAAKLDPRGL